MQITKLFLSNFRNYESQIFDFHPVNNYIIGQNGVGKTNVVEAIYMLALTKSFRSNNDHVVIKQQETKACIQGIIDNDKYELIISLNGKEVKINQQPIHRISNYISNIKIVLFNPTDINLIKDMPSERRKYLNIVLSQLDSEYLLHVSIYNQVIKQRNAYLKELNINSQLDRQYLDILTNKMVKSGLVIYEKRLNYLDNINNSINFYYQKITTENNLKVKYISEYQNKTFDEILKRYQLVYNKELALGKTLFGVHHDDFVFYKEKLNLREYGSEGQQKNAILALKFCEIKIFQEYTKKKPILIIDDLFSELDEKKISNIFRLIKKSVQTFITATDLKLINPKYLVNCNVYKIKNKKVEVKKYE